MSHGVIVVDMIRGFLEPSCDGIKCPLHCGDEAREIIPNIVELLNNCNENGDKIYFVCDAHLETDRELKIFPRHCIEGSSEAQVIPELRQFFRDEPLSYYNNYYMKESYSGFLGTELESKLCLDEIDTVTIVGVCTDICVFFTAYDAYIRGLTVKIRENCCASFDVENHLLAIQKMRTLFGALIV